MTGVLHPLSALPAGACATVSELRLAQPGRARLMELGLLPGTSVELIRFALLGDPLEVKVRGYHLTLPRHEAEQIWVRLADAN